jgi:hypothetical protein
MGLIDMVFGKPLPGCSDHLVDSYTTGADSNPEVRNDERTRAGRGLLSHSSSLLLHSA